MAACPYMPRPDETDEGQFQHKGTRPTAPETCTAGFELPGCPNGGATSGLPQDSRRNCCNAEVGTYVPAGDIADRNSPYTGLLERNGVPLMAARRSTAAY
jgi:hypothetical protein